MPEENNNNKMKIDAETQEKIQALQIYEQNFQSLLMQKQAFQMELNETENALSAIEKAKDDVFKLVGQVMIKTEKKEINEELTKKKELIKLRLDSIEKQEKEFTKQVEDLRKEVMTKLK